jgi:membrane-associated protein
VPKAIFLARFTPFARTLLNPIIGTIGYPVKKFFFWNLVSALVWTQGVIALGYFVGSRVEGSVDSYLLPVVGLILALSLIPVLVEILKERKASRDGKDI